jgi:hypothetical protein
MRLRYRASLAMNDLMDLGVLDQPRCSFFIRPFSRCLRKSVVSAGARAADGECLHEWHLDPIMAALRALLPVEMADGSTAGADPENMFQPVNRH